MYGGFLKKRRAFLSLEMEILLRQLLAIPQTQGFGEVCILIFFAIHLQHNVQGFEQTLPLDVLLGFSEAELCEVVCGVFVNETEPLWSYQELANTIVADHGYSSDSKYAHSLSTRGCIFSFFFSKHHSPTDASRSWWTSSVPTSHQRSSGSS